MEKKIIEILEKNCIEDQYITFEDVAKEICSLFSVVVPKGTLCDHSGGETLHQGNGFVYKTCADCGEDI